MHLNPYLLLVSPNDFIAHHIRLINVQCPFFFSLLCVRACGVDRAPLQLDSQLGALSRALLADPDLARTGLTRAATQRHRGPIVQRLTHARTTLFPAIPVSFISDVSLQIRLCTLSPALS